MEAPDVGGARRYRLRRPGKRRQAVVCPCCHPWLPDGRLCRPELCLDSGKLDGFGCGDREGGGWEGGDIVFAASVEEENESDEEKGAQDRAYDCSDLR